MFNLKFRLSSFYPDELRHIFYLFSKFSDSEVLSRASFTKILAIWDFYKNFKNDFNFFSPEFSQEISKFQNPEYEMHRSSSNDEE
jgi:hypothetical protein